MRCLIIDDEPIARKGLKEFIEQTPDLECVGEANNPVEALPLIAQLSPDLLFLDIQMPRMTGIDFVNNFNLEMPIIYTTAYSNYAVESFDLDVEDYLLKPIKYERFLRAIGRVYKALQSGTLSAPQKSFFVRSEGSWKRIVIDKILYVKSIQNYIKIQLVQGSYIVHQTLKSFANNLPQTGFLKVHKSYVVNLNRIDSFDGFILSFEEHTVPVSRNNVKTLKSILLSKEN